MNDILKDLGVNIVIDPNSRMNFKIYSPDEKSTSQKFEMDIHCIF